MRPSDRDVAEPRRVRAGGFGHEAGVGAGAHEAQPEPDELGQQLEVADAGDAEDRVVGAARLGHRAHRIEERLVAELPEDPHLGGEVVRAEHHHVEPGHRRDLVGPRDSRPGVSSITATHGLGVEEVEQLLLGHRPGTGSPGSGPDTDR